jgi:2-polyprenyl-6-methoxyphenol hydroxylase-like FAD-dependent oxidoreductase
MLFLRGPTAITLREKFAIDAEPLDPRHASAIAEDKIHNGNPVAFPVTRPGITKALHDALPHSLQHAILWNSSVVGLETNRDIPELLLDTGDRLPFGLVLFADGKDSIGRGLLGDKRVMNPAQYLVLQGRTNITRPPFLPAGHFWYGEEQGARLRVRLLQDGETAEWSAQLNFPQVGIQRELRDAHPGQYFPSVNMDSRDTFCEAVGRSLGPAPAEILRRATFFSATVMADLDAPPALAFPAGTGIGVLLGDAAGIVPPITSSGLSLGIDSAISLSCALPRDLSGQTVADILRSIGPTEQSILDRYRELIHAGRSTLERDGYGTGAWNPEHVDLPFSRHTLA